MAKLIERVVWDHGQPIPQKWAQESLGDGWFAEFRLEWSGQELVIAELRVGYEPSEGEKLEAAIQGVPPLPTGGLTARRLRGVRFEAVREVAREAIEQHISSYTSDPEALRMYLEATRIAKKSARPQKRGRWTDAAYVRLAARYVDLIRDGERKPIVKLAQEDQYSPARIRQALKHARDRGWLTDTPRRRPGGTLTQEALEIVQREEEER